MDGDRGVGGLYLERFGSVEYTSNWRSINLNLPFYEGYRLRDTEANSRCLTIEGRKLELKLPLRSREQPNPAGARFK